MKHSNASAVILSLLGVIGLVFFSSGAQAAHHHRHPHHFQRSVVQNFDPAHMALLSSTALVVDQSNGQVVYSKNPEPVHPIASITKLMTALVVLESGQALDETLTVESGDVDMLRFSRSHLRVGARASRQDFLRMALIASENRAAAALGRSFPGGRAAFVVRMNEQAQQLGMKDTHFEDSTGLSSNNVSTAHDLALLVAAAVKIPLIHEITTTASAEIPVGFGGHMVSFHNTNPLVSASSGWEIGLSKTGFINESGQCLVMQATINTHPMVIVLLDSRGHHARINDANRVRRWLEARSQTTVGQL